ncbi:MAG: ribose-phosphate pyrophosphokinase [Eubacteriales bacterium]|nr:ribose-phosphate pyrophosphokinase [Eubacteriales bacterium]MDY4897369.1 ribose-phosphate pyrophosphokinase [Eubacteriales bacterium]
MNDTLCGELSVIAMNGCEQFGSQVDYYLKEWRGKGADETFLVKSQCPRFSSGEAKGLVGESLRGHDLYIICDVFNHGVTFKMYGETVPMSPDDHYADLKRLIAATAGKARRVSVIMPMLYEGRQHKRSGRESLDCALMLQELEAMGVTNIITFDAHDSRIQNAVPLCGFDDVRPTYQMIKALIRNVPDIVVDKDSLTIISPDEGAMGRCMYYSSVLGIDIGMFYKRRDYTRVVNGRNPIEAHEYLGGDLTGKDVIVVDDIISSGDSLIDVALQLKQKGAKRIFGFVTFGLFTEGLEKFKRAYNEGLFDKIFTTNLVYRTPELLSMPWYVEVNMCKYVSYIIDTLNHDSTISNLLDPVRRIHNLIDKHKAEMEGSQMKINF